MSCRSNNNCTTIGLCESCYPHPHLALCARQMVLISLFPGPGLLWPKMVHLLHYGSLNLKLPSSLTKG